MKRGGFNLLGLNKVDSKQQTQINLIFVVLTGVTTFIAVHSYLQSRKSKKLDEEIGKIDLQIKQLTLEKLKNGDSVSPSIS